MNWMSLVILGITVYFLFFGLIFGLKRGFLHSILRLITVGIAFAAAWFLKDVYVAAAMNVEIGGFGVRALLAELAAESPALSSLIEKFAELALGVVLFVLVFLLLKLITLIVFGVLKIFVPKGKKRIFGMIVGLVQGALIAFCVCAPLNGLLVDTAKLADLDMGETVDTSAVQEIGAQAKAYTDGFVSSVYTSVGGGFYKALTTAENESGAEITISGCVDAAVSSAKITGVFESVANMDMSDGFTEENRDTIHQLFKDLDAIKGEMGEDSMEIVNEIVSATVADFGAELPESVKTVLEDFDLSEVNFEKEGDILMDLYDLAENSEGEIAAADVVNTLAESTVVLPVIESVLASEDTHIELPDEKSKAEVSSAIAGIEDPEVAEMLRNLFGLAA